MATYPYSLWKQEIPRLWLVCLSLFMCLAHIISCDQASDFLNYPHVMPNVRKRYIIVNDNGKGLTETKTIANISWQHFSNDAKSPTDIDREIPQKTVIQSLALILENSLMTFCTSNVSTQSKFKPIIQTTYMIVNAISQPAIEWRKVGRNSNDLLQAVRSKFISRASLLELYNADDEVEFRATKQSNQESPFTKTTINHENIETCQSCQLREKSKIKSLESIKNLILMRLQLTHLPNITTPIAVPHSIIDKFYKNLESKRNILLYNTDSETLKLSKGDMFHKSQTIVHGLSQTEENVALPYTKLAVTHSTQYRFEHSNTKTKFQTLHKLRGEQGHFTTTSRDSSDNIFDEGGFEHGEKDEDIQNDWGEQQYNNQQQIHNRNKQKEQQNKSIAYSEIENDNSYENIGDIDHESYSHINTMYIFPIASRVRHNRRWELINFKFDHNHLTIVRTIIHLYIRGRDWMREHYPEILEQKQADGKIKRRRDLVIIIHHVVRRAINQNITHTLKLVESRHRIPSGLGHWVQLEIKNKPSNWLNQDSVIMTLAIKTQESWMRSLLVIDTKETQNKQFPLHIEAFIKQPRRRKRSTSLDCQESDHEVRCCRYPLKVNFTNFGWNFVVAPTSFDAYFCNGECKVGYLEQYTHTHIASLTTSATPCCSPTKMSPLSLLYFDQDHNLVLSTIPNMSVEKCSCS